MKNKTLYQSLFVGLLSALLLFSSVLKETYHYVEHSHDTEKQCEAAENDVHIHDDSYHSHHCMLCHLTFSELKSDGISLSLQLPDFPINKPFAKLKIDYSPLLYQTLRLRGPPVSFL